MTRKTIIAGVFLISAAALGPAPGWANDRTDSAGGSGRTVEARVPLPVSRPAWIERTASASQDARLSRQLFAETGTASGNSGLKSGSAEALAVQLEGAKVLSSEGTVVGEVEKLVERQGGGRQAVVSVGGFLGIGESYVLVPAETLSPSGKGVVRTELTEQEIKSLPPYEM